ncbi:MAG: MarR family transcriptional regulator [Spirochaetales bacterium]|nr:MarR family transcriptional regulator [Spirochaetales bacterium]
MENSRSTEHNRLIAEKLFDAMRAVAPMFRRPGLGHTTRPAEYHLMYRLSQEQPDAGVRMVDLASWLGIRPPSVSQLVNSLESRGLVERYADPEDRRAIRVRLSASGFSVTDSFRARAVDEAEAVIDFLGEQDGEKLVDLLLRVSNFVATRGGHGCPGGCHHTAHAQGDE